MQKHWWKILSLILLLYTVIAGFLVPVPNLAQLEETIRNVFFHVPMWFGMIILYTTSAIYSILYLRGFKLKHDIYAYAFARIGTLFGILGLITGMAWARVAWGDYWNNDPKQIGAAITVLIYLAYFVLRKSVKDDDKRGRLTAVFNIFAYFMMFPAIYVVPGMMASLHPGAQGEDALMVFSMAPQLRLIFYPAVIGWTLAGVWMVQLKVRLYLLEEQL
jgi:heme exporter protein C